MTIIGFIGLLVVVSMMMARPEDVAREGARIAKYNVPITIVAAALWAIVLWPFLF